MNRTLLLLLLLLSAALPAQEGVYRNGKNRFLSYGSLPTWACVVSDWETGDAKVYLYDYYKFRGHSEFVASGLKRPITFAQFKQQVKHAATRKYIPLFLYDLRQLKQDSLPASLKGKQWAVRLEDYGYDDSPQQMAQTVKRLMKLLSTYIAQEGGDANGGVLLLYGSAVQKPNAQVLPLLGSVAFSTESYSRLFKSVGAPAIEVLSQGRACGYLRLIPSDSTDLVIPGPHDIAVYERSPMRVPAVAGYVSLSPQTPLSHVNLLALNRGTIHICMDGLKRLPGADTLLGKLVRIECTVSAQHIAPVSLAEAQRSWQQLDAKTIHLSPPDKKPKGIVDLGRGPWQYRSTMVIGAKAANYSSLQNRIPTYVRPGYAIPMHYYFNVIKHCGAKVLIDSLMGLPQGSPVRKTVLAMIRDSIYNALPDSALLSSIRRLQSDTFHDAPLRLRSSTNCEDLPGFNGAGLYTSERLDAHAKITTIRKTLLRVYASLWTEEAYDEREFFHIDHRLAGMAVLINEAFDDELANGVSVIMPDERAIEASIRNSAATSVIPARSEMTPPGKVPQPKTSAVVYPKIKPVTSAVTYIELPASGILINVQPGGHLVTNPDSGEVPQALVLTENKKGKFDVELKTHSSIADVFPPQDLASDSLLQELGDVTGEIYRMFLLQTDDNTYGIDIEFRIMPDGDRRRLWIKQARLLGSSTPY